MSSSSLPLRSLSSSEGISNFDGEATDHFLTSSRPQVRFASTKNFLKINTAHLEESPTSSSSRNDPRTPLLTPLRTPRTPSREFNTVPEAASTGRNINWSSAYFLIVSRVIGSGIFATPGVIAQSAGSIGLALSLWLLGAIISACGLAVSLELGCMLPRSGGEKVYLEFIYNRPRFLASTVVAVQAMFLGFTASNCIVFGKYMLFAMDVEPSDTAQRICAAGLILVVTAIHGRFLNGGIMIQNALAWIKIIVVSFMAITGIVVLLFQPKGAIAEAHDRVDAFSWDHVWEGSAWNFGTLATSFFKVSYAYSGFDNLNNVLDEVRNPRRTLKTAAPAAMLTIFIFYLLLNISYFVVVPLDEIKSSGELVAALFFERILGAGVGTNILQVLIALSAAGNVMVTTFAQARVNQQIARQGFLPFSRRLSSSAPYGTPLGGLLIHLIPSLAVILLPPPGAAYSFILEVKGYPAQMTSLATGCGLLWLRHRRPELMRPFKAWQAVVVLPIMLSCALLLAPLFPADASKARPIFWHGAYALVGIATILVALAYWAICIKLLPWWSGCVHEEELDELTDGTKITRLIRVREEFVSTSSDLSDCLMTAEDLDDEKLDHH